MYYFPCVTNCKIFTICKRKNLLFIIYITFQNTLSKIWYYTRVSNISNNWTEILVTNSPPHQLETARILHWNPQTNTETQTDINSQIPSNLQETFSKCNRISYYHSITWGLHESYFVILYTNTVVRSFERQPGPIQYGPASEIR